MGEKEESATIQASGFGWWEAAFSGKERSDLRGKGRNTLSALFTLSNRKSNTVKLANMMESCPCSTHNLPMVPHHSV